MLGLALWMLSKPAPARGAEQRIVCPDSLPAGAAQPRKNPPGWRLLMPQDAYLSKAGLVSGPPDESGYLKPLESKGEKAGRRSTWRQR